MGDRKSHTSNVQPIQNWTQREFVVCSLELLGLAGGVSAAFFILVYVGIQNIVAQVGLVTDLIGGIVILWNIEMRTLKKRVARKETEEMIRGFTTPLQEHLMMDESNEPKMFRSPHYTWDDFDTCVFPRPMAKKLVKLLDRNGFVVLVARPGDGKTTISLEVGRELLLERGAWRFVHYVDLAEQQIELNHFVERLHEIVDRMNRSSELGNKRLLLIIDNAHLNEALVGQISRRCRTLANSRVHFLFLARCTGLDITDDVGRWEGTFQFVEGALFPAAVEYIRVSMAHRDAEHIAQQYMDWRGYKFSADERKKILDVITEMCEGNLTFLRFVLTSLDSVIERTGTSLDAITKIKINDSLKEYYEEAIRSTLKSHEIEKITQSMRSPEDSAQLIRRIILLVSVFSSMEIPIAKTLAHKILETEDLGITLTNLACQRLCEQGELASSEDGEQLLMPHPTIAKSLRDAYPAIFSSISFGILLTKNELSADWPDEQAGLALLNYRHAGGHVPGSSIALVLHTIYKDSSKPIPARLVEKVLSSHSLAAEILASTPSISEKFLRDAVTLYLGATIAMAAAAIQTPEGQFLIEELEGIEELSRDPSIVSKVAETVENSDTPLDIVEHIARCEDLSKSEVIIESINKRIPDIVHAIEEMNEPVWPLFFLETIPSLEKSEVIQKAIEKTVGKIADEIDESPIPWFTSFAVPERLRRNHMIQDAVARRKDDLVWGIQNHSEPWFVLSGLRGYSIETHPSVQSAIAGRAEFIAQAILKNEFVSLIVAEIAGRAALETNDKLIDALARRIEVDGDPWYVIGNLGYSSVLGEKTEIHDAIVCRLGDLVSQLSSQTDQPTPEIVMAALSWNEIRENEEVKEILGRMERYRQALSLTG